MTDPSKPESSIAEQPVTEQSVTEQPVTEQPIRAVAIAILYQADRFLLQLRDDIPQIVHSGQWALFGGHLEAGETPDVAVYRELQEEIGHAPAQLTLFGRYPGPGVMRYVYHGAVDVSPTELVLGEGQDMGWFTADEIRRDECYSPKIRQTKPIGRPHRKILLDFLNELNHDA